MIDGFPRKKYAPWLRFLYFLMLASLTVLALWAGFEASCHSSWSTIDWNRVKIAPIVVGAAWSIWVPPAIIGAFLFTRATANMERRVLNSVLWAGIALALPAALFVLCAQQMPCLKMNS